MVCFAGNLIALMLNNFSFKVLNKEETAHSRDELRDLALQAYGSHSAVLTPAGAEMLLFNLGKDETWDVLFGNSQCFICICENKIVGMAFIILSGNPWRFFEKEWSYLRMVGVMPGFEGKGIGKKLTLMCIDYAREHNEKIIALHTSEFMHAARYIYEGLGFTIHKEIEPQWGKRYWVYTLAL